MYMEIYMIRSNWKERRGMTIRRDRIGDNYIFVHFQTPVKVYFDSEATEVRPGGCIFYESFHPQNFASPDCDLIHDWFHADSISCAALMKQYGLQCFKIYYPADTHEINHLIVEMELEFLRNEKFSAQRCEALMQQLCIALARSENADTHDGDIWKYKESFLKIRTELHSAANADCKVEDMAKSANMSVSRFFYIYRRLFGVSPKKDMIDARLARAKILLSNGNESVENIAALLGYTNQYHFIRQFKKEIGLSPGKYRRNAGLL